MSNLTVAMSMCTRIYCIIMTLTTGFELVFCICTASLMTRSLSCVWQLLRWCFVMWQAFTLHAWLFFTLTHLVYLCQVRHVVLCVTLLSLPQTRQAERPTESRQTRKSCLSDWELLKSKKLHNTPNFFFKKTFDYASFIIVSKEDGSNLLKYSISFRYLLLEIS